MNKNVMIKEITESTKLMSYEKKELLDKILSTPDSVDMLELEKYKFDKMIAAGMIKEVTESSYTKERWFQLLLGTLSDKKFMYLYAMTLWFIFMMFNSGKFWGFRFLTFGGK